MINLVKADLYKEIKKRSFKYIVMLIILVSILSLIVISKNVSLVNEEYDVSPLFSEKEYLNVNKFGNYKQYLNNYEYYKKVVNNENNLIKKNVMSKSEYVLSYSQNFVFLLGVIIIFISFHSFSYDYQCNSIRYVFMSKEGRNKILFSKILSNLILMLFFIIFLVILLFITTWLLTHENIFLIKKIVFIKNTYKEVLFIFEFLKSIFAFVIPLFFILVFSIFSSILFKGNSFGLISSIVIYFSSLVFSQIMFNYGFNFIQYTFLPYIDFTYLLSKVNVSFNNLIFNLNINYFNSVFFLLFYSIIFIYFSLKLIKRDV